MNKIAITAIAAAVAAGFALPTAASGGQAPDPRKTHHVERGHDLDGALALGLIGAGVVIGGAIGGAIGGDAPVSYRAQNHRDWRTPAYGNPHRWFGARQGAEPWTASWFQYCSDRYASFNARTGTYRGFDGRERFCEVPYRSDYRR